VADVSNRLLEGHPVPAGFSDAAIRLLHKGGSRADWTNYRPIALLTSLRRAEAKVFGNRLLRKEGDDASVMERLVHGDQAASVPGRDIIANIATLQLLDETLTLENRPAHAVFLDIKKAFDSLDHEYLQAVLTHAGLPAPFVGAAMALQVESKAVLAFESGCSRPFSIERGVKQGCPLSPLLFVVAIEPLACRLRSLAASEPRALGVSLPPGPFGSLPPQDLASRFFADDAAALTADLPAAWEALSATLEDFAAASGLEVNAAKTAVYRLGRGDHASLEAAAVARGCRWSMPTGLGVGVRYLGVHTRDALHQVWTRTQGVMIQRGSAIAGLHLSIQGRAGAASAYVASTASYLLETSPAPASMDQEAEKLVNTLVQGNRAAGSLWRRTADCMVFGPRAEGGLGATRPTVHVPARRMRTLAKILTGAPGFGPARHMLDRALTVLGGPGVAWLSRDSRLPSSAGAALAARVPGPSYLGALLAAPAALGSLVALAPARSPVPEPQPAAQLPSLEIPFSLLTDAGSSDLLVDAATGLPLADGSFPPQARKMAKVRLGCVGHLLRVRAAAAGLKIAWDSPGAVASEVLEASWCGRLWGTRWERLLHFRLGDTTSAKDPVKRVIIQVCKALEGLGVVGAPVPPRANASRVVLEGVAEQLVAILVAWDPWQGLVLSPAACGSLPAHLRSLAAGQVPSPADLARAEHTLAAYCAQQDSQLLPRPSRPQAAPVAVHSAPRLAPEPAWWAELNLPRVTPSTQWVLEPHRRPNEVPVPLPLQQYTVRHAVGAAFDRASITSRLARKVEEWSRAGALGEAQDGPGGVTAAGMHAALKTINALPLSPQMHEALWLTLADARATASHCYWLDLTTCPLLRRDGEQCSHDDTVAHAFWACDRAQEVWETVKAAARAPALSARAVFHLVPPSPSRFTQYSWAVIVGAAFKLIWRCRQELRENWRSPSTPAGLYAQLGAIVAAEVQDTLAVTGAGRLAALLGKRGDRLVLAHANGRRFSWRGFPATA